MFTSYARSMRRDPIREVSECECLLSGVPSNLKALPAKWMVRYVEEHYLEGAPRSKR
jgi:hypothetical protein